MSLKTLPVNWGWNISPKKVSSLEARLHSLYSPAPSTVPDTEPVIIICVLIESMTECALSQAGGLREKCILIYQLLGIEVIFHFNKFYSAIQWFFPNRVFVVLSYFHCNDGRLC